MMGDNQFTADPFWTDARVEQLTELVEVDGLPYAEIGRIMGITKNHVMGKASRLHLDHPNAAGPRGPDRGTILTRLDAVDVFPPPGGCLFPKGNPGDPEFRFCGAHVLSVLVPYCGAHTAVAAWVKEKPKRL
jgi:GcrA cell cycle regulator